MYVSSTPHVAQMSGNGTPTAETMSFVIKFLEHELCRLTDSKYVDPNLYDTTDIAL